jgi:hypothetical protein
MTLSNFCWLESQLRPADDECTQTINAAKLRQPSYPSLSRNIHHFKSQMNRPAGTFDQSAGQSACMIVRTNGFRNPWVSLQAYMWGDGLMILRGFHLAGTDLGRTKKCAWVCFCSAADCVAVSGCCPTTSAGVFFNSARVKEVNLVLILC